jgi:exodeoxyribonuclease V alpha subunit
MNMDKINGIIARIVYVNHQNGWTVCELEVDDEKVFAVGQMPVIAVGENVLFEGEWTVHAEYGRQFTVKKCEISAPKERDVILRYLSTGTIKGIRAALAEKIVNAFGENALNVLADAPEKLAKIKGISLKKAIEIGNDYVTKMGSRDVVMFLQNYGISPAMAMKIYHKYKLGAIQAVKENPYILCGVSGIGFEKADRIAIKLSFPLNSPKRLNAGVLHVMWQAVRQGHTNLPEELAIQSMSELLDVSSDEIAAEIRAMILRGIIILKNGCFFLPEFDRAEVIVARRIADLSKRKYDEVEMPEGCKVEHLDMLQLEAVQTALKNGFFIITGGPGTGKTTIIKTVIQIMQSLGKTVQLAAPTGRAAKRMAEVCGVEAKTIHRLLELERVDDNDMQTFVHCESNPLECDVLIVDEASMLDIRLTSVLLCAVTNNTRVIFVGDVDQLAPVGAGDVLRDIIKTQMVKVIKLTEIFRQSKGSYIVTNAHKINNGIEPEYNNKEGDFFLVKRTNAEDILSYIVDLVVRRIRYDCQVITPMRKGTVGVYNMNKTLQHALNPPSPTKFEYKGHEGQIFRVGDKIMQTKNNYDIGWVRLSDKSEGTGVFNGDIGYITAINEDDEIITAKFDDDKIVKYDARNALDIELAYCITVHKAQGSEYEAIVLPLFPNAPMLSTRNLLYTAITRARKMVVLVGREQVMKNMIDNNNIQKRYSQLSKKILAIGGLQ